MKSFRIQPNDYLQGHRAENIKAYYHTEYTGWRNVGNPDYLNILKNTFNSYSDDILRTAVEQLREALLEDLPQIPMLLGISPLVVCVVPRAKAENFYYPQQQLFRATVQQVIQQIPIFIDGTRYLLRHTNTKTTHFRRPVPNYNNDGPAPYPGITKDTCHISTEVSDKDILLVDDIYTRGVNVDEDAVNALLDAGARSVTFYAVGYTV